MHQQIAFLVVLLAFHLDDSSGHGKRRDSRGADERIDFAAGKKAHDFPEEDSRSGFDTGCFTTPMTIFLSWSVVSQRMIGGCINGTKDIYEYAATETAPSKCGANFELT